ncbi:MAG: prolyl oligopeptidase family serine peptidase [Spirochaetales bacterium]|nr:prolyl oligopeptidase family serine peptidase [Spirochaetales bacterium]
MRGKAFIICIISLIICLLPGIAQSVTESVRDFKAERAAAWDEYVRAMEESGVMERELASERLDFGDVSMRLGIFVVGEKPEGGYPLYIALHGGGSSETPDLNDSQWDAMKYYYREALDCGVYVAARGVRDTWDTHFNPESYPLYDRLIQYMILSYDVDPNRVYIEGFSAGGDGVYAITARMADRFAAANMSSGHHNWVNIDNLYNMPIMLQAGEYDEAYDRHKVTAEYGILLDSLQEQFPGHYVHRVLIHYNEGHNYEDYDSVPIPVMRSYRAWLEDGDRSHEDEDCYPPHWMDQFVRDPLPSSVRWNMGTRADMRDVTSFYYLRAPYGTTGTVLVSYDRNKNLVSIETDSLSGDFSVLLNEDMVDFSKPVTFVIDGKEVSRTVTPSLEVLKETTAERGDPNFQFFAEVSLSSILD